MLVGSICPRVSRGGAAGIMQTGDKITGTIIPSSCVTCWAFKQAPNKLLYHCSLLIYRTQYSACVKGPLEFTLAGRPAPSFLPFEGAFTRKIRTIVYVPVILIPELATGALLSHKSMISWWSLSMMYQPLYSEWPTWQAKIVVSLNNYYLFGFPALKNC